MKTSNLKTLAIILSLIAFTAFTHSTNAQKTGCGQPSAYCHSGNNDFSFIKNLNEEQKTGINNLKLQYIKETLTIKNQIAEKTAHLKTVSTGDNVDMTAVNQTIDDIYALKASLSKRKAAYMQDVRKLLNNEQKVMFDAHGGGNCMHQNQSTCYHASGTNHNCCSGAKDGCGKGQGNGKCGSGAGCCKGGGEGNGGKGCNHNDKGNKNCH